MTATWEGKPCPKCAYVRLPTDTNPAWQCPSCHIAYAKYQPRIAPIAARLVEDGREMAAEAKSDDSLLALLAANLIALAIAYRTGMSVRELMLVYWIQSVIIGASNFLRIVNLDRFDPADVTIRDEPVKETRVGKYRAALFFLLQYGGTHFLFLFYLLWPIRGAPLGSPRAYFLCALAFAISHGYSLVRNLRRDAAGRPSIGTMMFLPYARVVPMHVAAGLWLHAAGGPFAFFLFGTLKIFADVGMHIVEHHFLNKGKRIRVRFAGRD